MINVLWLDNDSALVAEHRPALEKANIQVKHVGTIEEAEGEIPSIQAGRYSLMLLDLMIPCSDTVFARYASYFTGQRFLSGLAFYKKNKAYFTESNTGVLVYSQLLLEAIIRSISDEPSIPVSNAISKLGVSDFSILTGKIISESKNNAAE